MEARVLEGELRRQQVCREERVPDLALLLEDGDTRKQRYPKRQIRRRQLAEMLDQERAPDIDNVIRPVVPNKPRLAPRRITPSTTETRFRLSRGQRLGPLNDNEGIE